MIYFGKMLSLCACLLLLTGFYKVEEGRGANSVTKITDISPIQWDKLAHKRIYFGHQSVGYNIIDGIRALMAEHPEIKIHIFETRDFSTINDGFFAHSKIGKNGDPVSKTDDFVKVMDARAGEKVDVAFHKYCYVDVNASTDTKKLFSNYKERINFLKTKYPGTQFVHITMPLTTVQAGPKAWIKKIIGKPLGGVEENVKRNLFNRLILADFQGKDPVFDLAEAEATNPDGSMATFTAEGKEYFALSTEYSYDGGHLNKLGQKTVSEKFLIFLTGIQ